MLGIGIDFGHGETAAAIFGRGEETAPTALELCGKKSIPSVLSIEQDGRVLIGNAALRSSASGVFYLGWKRRPSQMTKEEWQNTRCFMAAVWQELSGKYGQFLNPNQVSVYLATPNDWWNGADRREAELYSQIARDAGIPNVHIQHESQATMTWAKLENKNFITPQTMQRGLLVVDAGSSTLDFTYLRQNGTELQVSDRGVELGAALIDKLVLKQAVERSEQKELLEAYFRENPSEYRKSELEARFTKERYFRDGVNEIDCRVGRYHGEKLRLEAELDFDALLGTGPDRNAAEKISIGVTLNAGELSWAEHFAEILDGIMQQWQIAPSQLGCIIKTGGASRMPFISEMLKKTFGASVEILCDPEPDLCVAKGLAFIANSAEDGEFAETEVPDPMAGKSVELQKLHSFLNQRVITIQTVSGRDRNAEPRPELPFDDDFVDFRFDFKGQGWGIGGVSMKVILDGRNLGQLNNLKNFSCTERLVSGEHVLLLKPIGLGCIVFREFRHSFQISAGRKNFTLQGVWKTWRGVIEFTQK